MPRRYVKISFRFHSCFKKISHKVLHGNIYSMNGKCLAAYVCVCLWASRSAGPFVGEQGPQCFQFPEVSAGPEERLEADTSAELFALLCVFTSYIDIGECMELLSKSQCCQVAMADSLIVFINNRLTYYAGHGGTQIQSGSYSKHFSAMLT